jgi:predicted nucleic acid-binding protein
VSAVHAAFFDTSLVADAVAQSGRYATVRSYLDSLLHDGARVFVSDLVRIELAQAIKAIANDPGMLPGRERRRWRLHRWGDLQQVREDWYDHCFTNYDQLLVEFISAEEVALSRSIIESAIDLMVAFQIDSHDAIHIATALAVGASTLATLDVDFMRLTPMPGLTIHVIR